MSLFYNGPEQHINLTIVAVVFYLLIVKKGVTQPFVQLPALNLLWPPNNSQFAFMNLDLLSPALRSPVTVFQYLAEIVINNTLAQKIQFIEPYTDLICTYSLDIYILITLHFTEKNWCILIAN